jgi:hypothetical protein
MSLPGLALGKRQDVIDEISAARNARRALKVALPSFGNRLRQPSPGTSESQRERARDVPTSCEHVMSSQS